MRVRVQLTVTEVITVSRLVEADTTDEAEKKVEALWRSERGEHAATVVSAKSEQIPEHGRSKL